MNVSVDNFAAEIVKQMTTYTEAVTKGIEKVTDETASKILTDVKTSARSPHGDYRSGFAKKNKSLPGNRHYVVWNRRYYSLVHLLEKGHALRSGGRTRAFPHMGPAEQKYVPEYEAKVKQVIRNGG